MSIVPAPSISALRLIRSIAFRFTHPRKPRFDCPVCHYHGPFQDLRPETGKRLHARCACCGALERHRLQYLVMNVVLAGMETKTMRMLHFAPEVFLTKAFSKLFGTYETADISMGNVDHTVDICSLPFSAGSYDIVYASHVLEHVRDDHLAISEVRRILAPNGLAILPVPIVNSNTVEYLEPNRHESMHLRAPGLDYFDRFSSYFTKVDLYRSSDFTERHQLFTYEDRTVFPDRASPYRESIAGIRHDNIVPVCQA